MLTKLCSRLYAFLTRALKQREGVFCVEELPLPVAVVLASALGVGRKLLILPDPESAEQALSDATTLLPEVPCLPLSPADEEAQFTGERMAQVQAILSGQAPALIVTSIHALLQRIPEPKALSASSLHLAVGEDVVFDALAEKLTALGYERVDLVVDPQTFTVRGGILDVWPAGMAQPVRIEFFGDTPESIRLFDPATQGSVSRVEAVTLPPASGAKLKTVPLLPLLADASVFVHDVEAVYATLEQLPAVVQKRSNRAWFEETLRARNARVCLSGSPHREGVPFIKLDVNPFLGVQELAGASGVRHPDFFARVRHDLLTDLDERSRRGERVVICVETAAAVELLQRELTPGSPVILEQAQLSQGFRIEALKLSVVTQRDLYPTRRLGRTGRTRHAQEAGQRLEYAFDVEPGELVVHLEHGIGRFLGLTEIEVDGHRTEVFTLEYADGAKLHVPTSHAHLLSRYIGTGGRKVKLHSLDGARWRKEREAARRGIEDLAAGLLETQARRRVMPGFAFKVDAPWVAEFEALFPWQETPDQTRAIAEVKADMASPTAMDRLLCGDAGYGKTEVAMRAAFIAAVNHKQVALLAPTTVLAEQHYATFCERMASFPIKIDVLSRFRSPAQRLQTRLAAERGEVDILIGTHALLTENIPFHDLGLVIIDEEQRFGVAHKEQLKQLRALVDVLTMSATPIPRTLYLSLTGARDLSLLRTPPQNRVAVETIIQRDEDALVASAIRKELARGGQVFYLYNRVRTIGRVLERLRRIVPEVRVLVAHGQMPAGELAGAMRDFESGKADLLLCTTIVESGIDIPRANTMLIDRADRFGLAELYQLRGRVGRSIQKGFAYLLLPQEGVLDGDARKRLQALKRHSGLGAGYAIALRDLEIRGSGNLLGAAQSGHIAAIGFGLYCQLLRRTVARLKGEPIPSLVEVEVSLDILDTSPGAVGANAASIPYSYIEDDAQRMNVYRRLAETVSEGELSALRDELRDRYGVLPDAAERAFAVVSIRLLAAEKHLAKVEIRNARFTCFTALNHAPVRKFNNIPLPKSLQGEHSVDDVLAWVRRSIASL